MKNTKLSGTIKNVDKAIKIMKAMSHPMRVEIIKLLSQKDKMCVTEIYTELKLEQSTTSHHLGILKDSGILKPTRNGKQIYYSLNGKKFLTLLECLDNCAC